MVFCEIAFKELKDLYAHGVDREPMSYTATEPEKYSHSHVKQSMVLPHIALVANQVPKISLTFYYNILVHKEYL